MTGLNQLIHVLTGVFPHNKNIISTKINNNGNKELVNCFYFEERTEGFNLVRYYKSESPLILIVVNYFEIFLSVLLPLRLLYLDENTV